MIKYPNLTMFTMIVYLEHVLAPDKVEILLGDLPHRNSKTGAEVLPWLFL